MLSPEHAALQWLQLAISLLRASFSTIAGFEAASLGPDQFVHEKALI